MNYSSNSTFIPFLCTIKLKANLQNANLPKFDCVSRKRICTPFMAFMNKVMIEYMYVYVPTCQVKLFGSTAVPLTIRQIFVLTF